MNCIDKIKELFKKPEVKKTKTQKEIDSATESLVSYSADTEEYGAVVKNLSGLHDVRRKELENEALENETRNGNPVVKFGKKFFDTLLDPKVWAAAIPGVFGLIAWGLSEKREEEEKLSKPESFKNYDQRGFR